MTQYNHSRYQAFRRALHERVLVLDGSIGVLIQRLGLTEQEYRGHRFLAHPKPLAGDVDILCITAEHHVRHIHRTYLEAGADIIETNTFNSNALSQAEYGMSARVRQLNLAGVRLAREEAERMERLDPSRPRFVAGSMGPTSLSASLPCNVNDPSARAVDFDTLSDAACEQAGSLIDGGADMLILETAFDTLNTKALLHGIRRATAERGADIPLIVSATISDASGRMLSGHTVEAFLTAIRCYAPDAVGLNCGSGPAMLVGHFRNLAAAAGPMATVFYPNAGLPDRLGRYSESPETFVAAIRPLLADGLLNIVGGCCGTDAGHISALAAEVRKARPRQTGAKTYGPWLAGLDAFDDNRGFANVGERCNVAGSRKFLRLINEKSYDEALAIARKQVNDGAIVLDINLDDGMLDGPAEMERFLRLLGSDPVTAAVPWMIDTSNFDVVETALRNVAGKPIVNSISLKHGEAEFLRQAAVIRQFGAAVVVMAFDEDGQADTLQRRKDICARAYRLLTEEAGFAPRDIIFDPNVLTVATGMPEHDSYALDFIEAVRWIKANLPGAKTSGGVSNLSFAFRGNNYLRQAMHAVFLYHAIAAGLDMAIVDPGTKVTYDDIPADLLERIEDVILFRRKDAGERLAEVAGNYLIDSKQPAAVATAPVRPEDVDRRLSIALRTGDDSNLEDDLAEAMERHGSATAVVEGPLMEGMDNVGKLFEAGRMFLPQVVKSARVMHRAVEILRPALEANAGRGASKGLFLTATVKGDVHDIGKNIVNVVMRCNNFRVVDLGVQVEAERIVAEAKRLQPDAIGLSGLIAPSLDEMANVADALQRAGLKIPLILGGAATSELHTAIKIAPRYDGVVVRVSDAAKNPVIVSRLIADPAGEGARIRARQQELRDSLESATDGTAAACRPIIDWDREHIDRPAHPGVTDFEHIDIATVRPFINWTYFYNCWKTPADTPEAAALRGSAETLLDTLATAGAAMQARVALLPAYSDSDDSIVINGVKVPTPRQKPSATREECLALCDFVAPQGHDDNAGVFMVTIGDVLRRHLDKARQAGEDYDLLLLQSVCDRLAEATSEWLHLQVRTKLWGYAPDENADVAGMARIRRAQYRGIRPAVGYPSLPDQQLMHTLAKMINPTDMAVTVTDNGALIPSSTVAGFYLASPRARYFTV